MSLTVTEIGDPALLSSTESSNHVLDDFGDRLMAAVKNAWVSVAL